MADDALDVLNPFVSVGDVLLEGEGQHFGWVQNLGYSLHKMEFSRCGVFENRAA